MPPDPPRPGNPRAGASKPAWKGAAAPAGKVGRGPKYAWKPQEQAAVESSRWARRAKLSGLAVGGFGCVALIVLLIWWLRPQKGACLVLVGADPAADIEKLDAPLDPLGWSAGNRLGAWSAAAASDQSGRNKLTPKLPDESQPTPELVRPADLPAFLQKLERRELEPLIIYFGLHGGSDANGPFLFTSGGERLYLRELIEGFTSSRLKDKHVVLIFDPSRMEPDPAVGMMYSDCVRGLKQLDEEGLFAKVPKLVVICANDAGERGWSAEEWGTSGFAQVLLRGLGGAATPSRGVLITASDLFDYVHDTTESWSQAARPTPMSPILLPSNDGRERAKDMVLTAKIGDPEDWPVPSAFTVPEALVKHWTTAGELEKGTPNPGVYSPKLWRRYRELLLRYGQLLRAGEDAAARRLSDILDRAEQELRDGRALRLTDGQSPKSRGNALPLPAALGLPTDATANDAAFKSVWRAQEAEWDKAWESALANSKTPADLLRTRFYDFLLQRATDKAATREDLDKAARLMARPWLAGVGTPRPAEAHLLVMTRDFFIKEPTGEPPLDQWKRALDVRRLAERAALGVTSGGGSRHPYSEALWTHLGPPMEKADIFRRDGEDWLFASVDAVRARAGDELESAKKQYELVLEQARVLQKAYEVRDEALADLPLLTRWVASLPAQKSEIKVQAEAVKLAWPKVHALARRLDGSDRPTGPDRLTEEIREALTRLKQEYRDHCRKLADKDLQGQWEAIEQVMAVPPMLIEPDLRKDLLESGRRQAKKLTDTWMANPTLVARPASTEVEDARTARQAQAVQQAELAVAVLGDIPKDQPSDRKGALLGADNMRGDLAKIRKDNWQITVNTIGEHVARHWQVLNAPPDKDTAVNDDLAESHSRWAVAFRPIDGPEPATVNRLKRWQKLFVGMALRTVRDHWFEVEKKPNEYFVAAANLFIDDAKKAVGGSTAVPGLPQVEELRTAEPLQLEPTFDRTVKWTSDNRRTLTFAVKAPKFGPGGYVTLWPQMGSSTSLSLPGDDLPRQPVALPAAKRDLHVEAKRTATDDTVKLTGRGYFRGQWLTSETEIKLNRTPELIVSRATPPNDAAVAVRAADNLDLGAISIVVDYSGSMAATPSGKEDWKSPDSKNQQALKTLQEVLISLPPETPISLRLFGHKYDKPFYAKLFAGLPNKEDKAALDVIGTQATLSELIYKGKVTWSPANPQPLAAILSQLQVKPEYGTPLARTMIEAKDDFPEGYKGNKTLLVLTDGADTTDPEAVRVAAVKQRLQNGFAGSNISIQMVLFRVDDAELKTALEQFKEDVEEKLQPPGRVWVAGENSKLRDMIDFALRPKLRLEDLSGVPAKNMARGGLPANRPKDELINLRWTGAVDPKLYRGYVFKSQQMFSLQRGDRMLVRLFKESTGVRFERDLLADDPRLAGRTAKNDDWMLALPYYHSAVTLQDKQLWATATVETPRGKSPGRDGTVQQTRPEFVWWDVAAEAGPRPKTVRVTDRWQLPAPAWNILAEGWPGGVDRYKPAVIRAWADFARPPAAYQVQIDPARLAAADTTVEAIGEDGKVQVMASLEEWPLRKDTDPRKDFSIDPPPPEKCLVIRVLHPEGKPVYVRPAGVAFDASEQRYYPPSAAVTAVFGPVISRDDLEAKLQGQPLKLDLVSIGKFQADHPKPVTLTMPSAGPEQPLVSAPELGEKLEKAP